MRRIIVLLTGWAGSGKDAAASLLMDEYSFVRLAFADALREDASELTGIPVEQFATHGIKDAPLSQPCRAYPLAITPREILLAHALVRRATDPDIYSCAVAFKAREHERVVISDWRQTRERVVLAAECPTASIVSVRIVRSGIVPRDDPLEHELNDCAVDLTITNDGCISDLRDALKVGLRPWLQ